MTRTARMPHQRPKQHFENVEQELSPLDHILTASCQVNKYSPVTSLIGKRLVTCYLQGHKTEALWDTGSQVCIVDEQWRNMYIPEVNLKDISEATEALDGLQLVAANRTGMPYVGWVEITFKLASPVDSVEELVIPVLVLKDQRLSKPTIGYNVIEQVMRQSEASEDNEVSKGRLHKIVKYTFPGMKQKKTWTV